MTSGTFVCGVTETGRAPRRRRARARARGAARAPARACARRDGVPPGTQESLTARQRQAEAARALDEIARDIGDATETRIVLGYRAEALAQVAAEEGADLIVIGSRPCGIRQSQPALHARAGARGRDPVPVVVAPPSTRRRGIIGSAVAAAPCIRRSLAVGSMRLSRLPLLWRVFAINAALVVGATLLLALTPVTIHAPIALVEAVDLAVALAVMLAANLALLRHTLRPIDRLVQRMRTVDLLRPGQRIPEQRRSRSSRAVATFNEMLDRLEAERRESGQRALRAQEAERRRIARGLHDEVGQVLTGVLLQLEALPGTRRRSRRCGRRSRRYGGSRASCGPRCSSTSVSSAP